MYGYTFASDGRTLFATPHARFAEQAAGLGANEKAVAGHLQRLFDGGAIMDSAFNRLASVTDNEGYAAGLNSLAGQGLGAFGAFRFNSSRKFAANLYGGCQTLQLEGWVADHCGWRRVLVNNTTQTAGADTQGYEASGFASQKGVQLPLSVDLAVIGSIAYENTVFKGLNGSARITGESVVGGVGLLFKPKR